MLSAPPCTPSGLPPKIAVYADGGLCLSNPSPYGGSWAYVMVDENQKVFREQSGFMTPQQLEMPVATNNVMELYALVRAILCTSVDASPHFYTDSKVTLLRVFGGSRLANVPAWLLEATEAAQFLLPCFPGFAYTLLQGHPSQIELNGGTGDTGRPVSIHNARCDELCRTQANYWQAKNGVTAQTNKTMQKAGPH